MIDPSIHETLVLVLRPFTDELGEGWKVVRAACIVFLVITIMLWLFATFTPEQPRFERARDILNVSGWVTFLMFVFTYLACCIEAYTRQKEKRAEKLKKLDEFH